MRAYDRYFKGSKLRKRQTTVVVPASSDEQERELRAMLARQGMNAEDIDREVQLRQEMSRHYAQPVDAAKKRARLLKEAYDAKRPGHRSVFLQAAKRVWT
ncbi:MAG: hypothetical protein QOH67_4657 [Hyphomicrobiales bacterium]|jgi:hypothetical protein|nr:hypothetical protein [Hyphomicrobiales bacterium]